ncbi:MAG: hypothetical protein NTV79_02110 [Candidatus Aureabacteria bacterium]|nr:hypothetical protein [Candidatus Auribacterota bacterium]
MNNMGHIVWYADLSKLDLKDPWLRKWWIRQVLVHGRFEDIRRLDFNEIEEMLPSLRLPPKIKSLWMDYFSVVGLK